MKLINKTSTWYFIFALPVFVICAMLIYFFTSAEIRDDLDESLWKDKTEIEQKIREGTDIAALREKTVTVTSSLATPDHYAFQDTSMYDAEEGEIIPYRVLNAYTRVGKGSYHITIHRSYVEADDLIFSIFVPISGLFILLFTGVLIINYFTTKRIWRPFYNTITKLKDHKLDGKQIIFPKETVTEFNELNNALNYMLSKAHDDFQKQKEFTENASHEMQTPLAIIRGQIELLIQSPNLGNDEMAIITGIYAATNRLAHLNRSLLLLTKISNDQFPQNSIVNVKSELQTAVAALSSLAEHKQIRIGISENALPVMEINPLLCGILFSNLLGNAIIHNQTGGFVNVQLEKDRIVFTNSGQPTSIPASELFERFKKDTTSNDSTGLGLAIVKSICDLYSISVIHKYHNGEHSFTLKLPENKI